MHLSNRTSRLCETCSNARIFFQPSSAVTDSLEVRHARTNAFLQRYTTSVTKILQVAKEKSCAWCDVLVQSLVDCKDLSTSVHGDGSKDEEVAVSLEFRGLGAERAVEKWRNAPDGLAEWIDMLASMTHLLVAVSLCATSRSAQMLQFGMKLIDHVGQNSRAESRVGESPGTLNENVQSENLSSHPTTKANVPHASIERDKSEATCWSTMLIEQTLRLQDNCTKHHKTCSSLHSSTLPTRLIKIIHSENGALEASLYHPQPGEKGTYAALSYCWGVPQPYTHVLNKGNIAKYSQAIPLFEMPKTVLDAVTVTSDLGMAYLWIDSLCIIQDDPDDKREQIKNMRHIFKYSHLTIVASCAASVSDGFLAPFEAYTGPTFEVPLFALGDNVPSKWMDLRLLNEIYYPPTEPVNHRAWPLEERLLSSNLLVFTTKGIIWQCQTQTLFLDNPDLLSPFVSIGRQTLNLSTDIETARPGSQLSPVQLWQEIVTDYTTRHLTFLSDKLVAIAGVAEELHSLYLSQLGDYIEVAGMWSMNLADQLYWEVVSSSQSSPLHSENHSEVTSQESPRIPSWSWASVNSPVLWRKTQPGQESQSVISVRSIQSTPVIPSLLDGETEVHSPGPTKLRLEIRAVVADAFLEPPQFETTASRGSQISEALKEDPVDERKNFERRIQNTTNDKVIGRCKLDTSEFAAHSAALEVICIVALIWDDPTPPEDGSAGIVAVRVSGEEDDDMASYRRIGSYRGLATSNNGNSNESAKEDDEDEFLADFEEREIWLF